MPADQSAAAAERGRMAARDQARRFPRHRPQDGDRVRLYSRPGNDLTYRFPLIVEALARLRSHSCIIDGEAVACDDNGVASFNLVRYRHHDESIFLYAFDLIELNGDDLRPERALSSGARGRSLRPRDCSWAWSMRLPRRS
jgi:ATP dependent DNA ligase domain